MAIISQIGRKAWRVRLLVGLIYAGLTLGAVTMVYPFLLMIAGSTKSAVDAPDPHVVPPYLISRTALYQKYVESLFNESSEMMKVAYGSDAASFRTLQPPGAPNAALASAWVAFCEATNLPCYAYMLGEVSAPRSRSVLPFYLREFKHLMMDRSGDDVEVLNRDMHAEFANWNAFYLLPEDYLSRRNRPNTIPLYQAFRAFKARQPVSRRYYFSADGYYRMTYLQAKYGRDIRHYNTAIGGRYAAWSDVPLPRTCPALGSSDAERSDWEHFVRAVLNLFWLRADPAATPLFHEFLQAKYGQIDVFNNRHQTNYASFAAVPLVAEPPSDGLMLSDWGEFIEGWRAPDTGRLYQLPAGQMRIASVDGLFRDYLQSRYGSLDVLNRALGTHVGDWANIRPPQQDLHYLDFLGRTGELRREFTVRNYITVCDYIVRHGRGAINTFVYCSLAILAALIFNPLAAYALSRYKPPNTYQIMLFLMLTMAFPPMVAQIPAFLMLRDFGLLNTFWALILPGLANGYSIFLLKGFFDSLPQELYECAAIDGAGELRVFWQISMRLSTPILAVTALSAFTMAYGNFMMALLVCQDERMWTIMPWLYQLQGRSGEGVIFASLLIASLPTLVVFLFCQNVIMRGIVIPVEK